MTIVLLILDKLHTHDIKLNTMLDKRSPKAKRLVHKSTPAGRSGVLF